MADENALIVEIQLDDGSVKKGFIQLENQSKKTAKNIGDNFSRAERFKGLTSSLFNLRNVLIGVGSAFAIGKIISTVTRAASEQEVAVNQLNTSLKLAGTFSSQASESFQNLARSIQANSTFGDETILQFAALARNFTTTNEEAEKLTRAAVDLSAATGLSLESSVKNLGKTFAGLTGELGESVPALRNLTAEQLKSGAAIDLILERFGGAAQAQLNTFSGVVQSASNNFGDLAEGIGSSITSSPVLVGVIKEINKIIVELSNSLRSVDGAGVIDNLIIDFIDFASAVNSLLIAPVEIAVSTIETAFNAIRTIIQGAIVSTLRPLNGLAKFFAPDSEITKNLNAFTESSALVLSDFADQTKDSFNSIGDSTIADNIEDVLGRVRNAAIDARDSVAGVGDATADATNKASQNFVGVGEAFSLFSEGFKAEAINLANTAEAAFSQAGQAAFKTLGQGVGRAFAAFGAALANGENALEAFGKAFLATIAQGAIALGTEFVLRGIAYSFVPGLQALGPPLIAAGATLAAFGGALSAVSGGGGTAGAGGGGAGASADVGADDGAGLAAPDPQPSNQINVNIAGDVFDSEDSGLRIATLLQNELDKSGNSILQVT